MPLIRKDRADITAASDRDVDALAAGLRSANADERWRAARVLGDVDGALGPLSAAAAIETDLRVREAIFTSLVGLPAGRGLAAAAAHLGSDDADLRAAALDALKTIGPAVAPMLPVLLEDGDPDVRGFACDLARQLPAIDAARLLGGLLDREPVLNVCAAAVDVLAEIGEASAAPALVRCAARFADQPFLGFAIQVALDRIGASRPGPA